MEELSAEQGALQEYFIYFVSDVVLVSMSFDVAMSDCPFGCMLCVCRSGLLLHPGVDIAEEVSLLRPRGRPSWFDKRSNWTDLQQLLSHLFGG